MVSSVLFIDDDQINTALSKKLLLRLKKNLSIQIVNDAQSGLDLLKHSENPDLIFLDLNMPGMDGVDFMKEFHKLNISSKIIILTSIGLKEDTTSLLKNLGCKHVLIKPLTEENIHECLEQ